MPRNGENLERKIMIGLIKVQPDFQIAAGT